MTRTSPAVRLAWIGLTLAALAGCGLFMSPERRIARAEQFIAEGDWGSAAIELRQALEASPDDAHGRLLLARVAYHTGDLRAAEKEATRATELKAPVADVVPLQAEIKLALGEQSWIIGHLGQPIAGL